MYSTIQLVHPSWLEIIFDQGQADLNKAKMLSDTPKGGNYRPSCNRVTPAVTPPSMYVDVWVETEPSFWSQLHTYPQSDRQTLAIVQDHIFTTLHIPGCTHTNSQSEIKTSPSVTAGKMETCWFLHESYGMFTQISVIFPKESFIFYIITQTRVDMFKLLVREQGVWNTVVHFHIISEEAFQP